MTRWTLRATLGASLVAALATGAARTATPQSSIVIVTGGEAALPIPTLMEGAQAKTGNYDIADQLFLRLAELGPTLITAGDKAFVPALARSWSRRDSLTLAFELDPRATDGTTAYPVTAKDVVFTFGRARDPRSRRGWPSRYATSPRSRPTASIAWLSASRTSMPSSCTTRCSTSRRFRRTCSPISHPADLARFALRAGPGRQRSVPLGPERCPDSSWSWRRTSASFSVRRRSGGCSSGWPPIADARLNLLLGGEADAMDNIPPPRSNLERVAAQKDLRIIPVPSSNLGYLLFNQRDPADLDRPHPSWENRGSAGHRAGARPPG